MPKKETKSSENWYKFQDQLDKEKQNSLEVEAEDEKVEAGEKE